MEKREKQQFGYGGYFSHSLAPQCRSELFGIRLYKPYTAENLDSIHRNLAERLNIVTMRNAFPSYDALKSEMGHHVNEGQPNETTRPPCKGYNYVGLLFPQGFG
ncbi:MAG TPA: hypothetical protein VE267_11680 [Bradyrhizobium sp.]|nr:hypothetical protein [Bradyrhizobium sp.]